MIQDNYRVEYVFCTCPACKKKIPLKVYAKVPILRVEIDETCGGMDEVHITQSEPNV